jgi:capsular exopolysaccharide synthesis family protein
LRRWPLIVVTFLVTFVVGLGLTLRQNDVYEAQAQLFVGQQRISQTDLPLAQNLTQTSLALVKSYSQAIRTRPVIEDAIKKLGPPDDAEQVLERLKAEPVEDTQIIRVTFQDESQERSRDFVNAVAQSFIGQLERIDPNDTGKSALQVSVLEPAVTPDDPVSPQPLRSGLLALAMGSLLALAIVAIAERLDSTVKGRADVEEQTGQPVLAIIPHVKTERGGVVRAYGTPAGEAYRNLRSAVQYAGGERRAKILAVSSPESADGKTSTALNLAIAFAEAGVDVFLVEADMRRPSLAKHLRMPNHMGLADYLSADATMDEIILRGKLAHLYVVPAGTQTENASLLLERPQFQTLLTTLAERGRIVIVDTPPVLAVSDPVSMIESVDGFILVARSGKTKREHLTETMRVLGGSGATVFGVVVNDLSRSSGFGYGYGYGYSTYGASPTDGDVLSPLPPVSVGDDVAIGSYESAPRPRPRRASPVAREAGAEQPRRRPRSGR